MINELLSRAFILSNKKINVSFKNATTSKVGEYYFTSFKKENISFSGNLEINFRTMEICNDAKSFDYGLSVNGNIAKVKNNIMNTRDIYYIYEPTNNLFVVFNHLLLAKEILEACALEVTYSSIKIYENGSHFKHIHQIQFAESIICEIKNGKVALSFENEKDILTETEIDTNYTIETAKDNFYAVLFEATKRLTMDYEDVSIPLSGGLDSGSIAYLLAKLGKNVTAYSIGTEWGNEYNDAASTANYIGIRLNQIYISREDIFREIPCIIAAFGFNVSSNVEISLVPQCLFRKVEETNKNKNILFATGFGSDLLNAGIFKPFDKYSELYDEIITTLKKTRMPNETYSNLFFQNNSMFHNINVVHPFWETSVIEESLRIPVEFKVSENRDKYFFRKLMEDKMGYENCWRKKWAAHHGTGIGFNLMQAIGGGDDSFGRDDYEKYFRDIHEKIFYKNDFSIIK